MRDSENYIIGVSSPMQTPPCNSVIRIPSSLYAILGSVPNKLLGVIAMFSALLVIMVIAITDLGLLKGWLLKPLSKVIVAFLYFFFLIS